jgi:hypothetical protein
MHFTKSTGTVSMLTLAIGLAVNGYSQSFLTNGLVAYYPFNGNANDASGNGNNGTAHGATLTTDRFGYTNQAYSLNGTSAYILVPNAPANNVAAQFTISFWMNPKPGYGTPFQNNIPIVCKWGGGGAGNASYEVGVTSMGQLYVAMCDPTQTTQATDTSVTTTGVWHQVILVRDGAGFHLYRDNALLFSTNSLVQPQPSVYNLNFGGGDVGDSAYYGGGLDDIRIYNRALSASEIQQLYVIESGPRVDFVKAFTVDYSNLTLGSNYQLQASSDLLNWTNYGNPFTATSVNYTNTSYQRIANWNSLYFRLQATQ